MKPTRFLIPALASMALALNGYAQTGGAANPTKPASNTPPATTAPAANPAPATKSESASTAPDRTSDQENSTAAAKAPAADAQAAATADASKAPIDSPPAAKAADSGDGLTPTGKSSGATTPNATPVALLAGKAVRIGLDLDANLAKADIQVEPQGDHVVLKGAVGDEQMKQRAYNTAYAASGAVKVDNQISVRK